jgi:L-ribulokinase
MNLTEKYVVGIDFGTLSGRTLVVRVSDGEEIYSATYEYPHGVIDEKLPISGVQLPPDWALQVPQDYIEVLKHSVPKAIEGAGIDPKSVIGIGTDFTACTVLPTLKDGTPLCDLPEFSNEPHAYAKLWKHHAAQTHADRINNLAEAEKQEWVSRYGGKISSEWEFAKALQLLEEAPHIYEVMERWVEASDWIVWKLTGNYLRNITATGFKAIYQDGEYPSQEFLTNLNPNFGDFVERCIRQEIGELGQLAGLLNEEAAKWTGLPVGTPVCVGNVDAHVTSAAAQAIGDGQMVAIMGTSTCHVMNHKKFATPRGICGVVKGGISRGSWGYEAGQSGVGDIFNWMINNLANVEDLKAVFGNEYELHDYYSKIATSKSPGYHGLIALDWVNGNRSVLVDHNLSGLIVGLTLATTSSDIYSALVESTAFGARKIIETFNEAGLEIKEFIAAGGLIKNSYLMQIYSDILNRPIHILESEQGPALGSAIHAAVAAGAYKDIAEASRAMGRLKRNAYLPRPQYRERCDRLYSEYIAIHNYFSDGKTMHTLRSLRENIKH